MNLLRCEKSIPITHTPMSVYVINLLVSIVSNTKFQKSF